MPADKRFVTIVSDIIVQVMHISSIVCHLRQRGHNIESPIVESKLCIMIGLVKALKLVQVSEPAVAGAASSCLDTALSNLSEQDVERFWNLFDSYNYKM